MVPKKMLTRRQFIKALGVLGGAFVAAPRRLGQGRYLSAVSTAFFEGELYGGFVLLREGMAVPAIVRQPRLPVPILCGAGVGRGGPEPTASTESVNNSSDLARKLPYPQYTLSTLPIGLRPAGAYLIRYNSGEIFGSSVNYDSLNAQTNDWEGNVRIWAHPDFPRPFPLWSSGPMEPDGPAVILEKADFLPTPGIRVASQAGYLFYWIERGIFYMLIVEDGRVREEAQALAGLLTLG